MPHTNTNSDNETQLVVWIAVVPNIPSTTTADPTAPILIPYRLLSSLVPTTETCLSVHSYLTFLRLLPQLTLAHQNQFFATVSQVLGYPITPEMTVQLCSWGALDNEPVRTVSVSALVNELELAFSQAGPRDSLPQGRCKGLFGMGESMVLKFSVVPPTAVDINTDDADTREVSGSKHSPALGGLPDLCATGNRTSRYTTTTQAAIQTVLHEISTSAPSISCRIPLPYSPHTPWTREHIINVIATAMKQQNPMFEIRNVKLSYLGRWVDNGDEALWRVWQAGGIMGVEYGSKPAVFEAWVQIEKSAG
ncbi:hypothetical protein BGX38DRAFT_1146948 [Terfezia claveryi]|nr:hypothetical protein BGX38DRAFT_1146948 [Terfezia claveryi]